MMDARTKALQMAQVDLGTLKTGDVIGRACHCMGPRNGEPLCPCAMRGVIVRDGRYVLPERDLGPVASVEGERFSRLLADVDGLVGIGEALLARHR